MAGQQDQSIDVPRNMLQRRDHEVALFFVYSFLVVDLTTILSQYLLGWQHTGLLQSIRCNILWLPFLFSLSFRTALEE